MPLPSGEQPRTSTACAETTRPSASSSSETATCSLRRRRREGGHRDPVLDALGEHRRGRLRRDRMRQRTGLDHQRLAGPGQLRERALVALGLGLLQPRAEAGQRRLQQLDRALLRARDRGHETRFARSRAPRRAEAPRSSQREMMSSSRRRNERVLVRGVELDGELIAGEAERIVDRSQNPGGIAERERVLQVARSTWLPQVRALEQLPHARRCAARCPDTAWPARPPGEGGRCWRRSPPSRARRRREASSRRIASASASAARPVPKELLLISDMPSFAARGMSPQMP